MSGNSIEEKLLKNGTKDLIREVAAQGNDYFTAFLTQVPRVRGPRVGLPRGACQVSSHVFSSADPSLASRRMTCVSVQRTIQELFEVYSPMDDAGFPVKAEEFVVLSQEPSVTETIAPKIARPFIEVRVHGAGPTGVAAELPRGPA